MFALPWKPNCGDRGVIAGLLQGGESIPNSPGVQSVLAVLETEEPDVLCAETSAPVSPDPEGLGA